MIFQSPYPDVTIPDSSVTNFALQRSAEFSEKTALIDGSSGATISYGELSSSIRKAASGLASRGFGKGDVLAIYSPNCIAYPIAFHGAAYAGGVVTTVNPQYTPKELASQLKDSQAQFLVTTSMFLTNAQQAAAEAGNIQEIFTFDNAPGATPFSVLLEAPELEIGPAIDSATDLVALPYSSGTTGGSKGVMLTHRNLVANMAQLAGLESQCRPITEEDKLIAVLPFFSHLRTARDHEPCPLLWCCDCRARTV